MLGPCSVKIYRPEKEEISKVRVYAQIHKIYGFYIICFK